MCPSLQFLPEDILAVTCRLVYKFGSSFNVVNTSNPLQPAPAFFRIASSQEAARIT